VNTKQTANPRTSRKHHIFSQCAAVLIMIGIILGLQPENAVTAQQTITFSGAELLGRPTDTSISIKIVPDSTIQYYYQYGTSPGTYSGQTDTVSATGGEPHTVTITGLSPNTHYYYRMHYNYNNTGWVARPEHSFWTQRDKGEEFVFDITSDSHVNIMLGSAAVWTDTLNNVAADDPDFLIDLGDTFAMDNVTTLAGADSAYLFQRDFFDIVGHSASIYLAMGNHEQTEGWHFDGTNSLPVWSFNSMKKYYLNPSPDGFYSGNEETFSYIDGDGKLQDYFAWEWGDALFVFIDPFWYTTTKPYTGTTGGGESAGGSGDRWDWSLGQTQFNWLKTTVQNSNASYKFVFAHHMVGGSDDYVRGGAEPAHLYEWGGGDDESPITDFETERPITDWGSEPIHQFFVANGVSAFFHGHDHQYAYEVREGVVYQSLPAAGFTGGGFGIYNNSPYAEMVLDSSGHLRVTVSPTITTVDYVRSGGSGGSYSYTIEPSEQQEGMLGDVNGSGGADSTDALIVLSADAGINVVSYCPMNCGDANGDGFVNSTDALILLSFDAGLPVSFGIGEQGCPQTITQPPGCTP